MISVPEEVERLIKQSPFLEEALSEGILNLSSLARKIQPEIEENLMKSVTEGSIVMALKRLSTEVENKQNDFSQNIGDMIVRSNLISLTYKNSDNLQLGLEKILERQRENPETFLNFSRGTFETTIVCKKNLVETVKKKLSKEILIFETNEIASISIKLSDNTIETPGVYYAVLKVLSWQGVNVIEVLSTYREFTIMVEENDIDRAFGVLKKSFR